MRLIIICLILCKSLQAVRSYDIFVELTCNNKTLNFFTCERNSLINNASSIDDIVYLFSVNGGYSIKGGEMALKLVILDSNIKHLPNKISEFFPNLIFFGVIKSSLQFVKRENFQSMEMVKTLDLRRNELSTLPDDAFIDLRNLRKIDLTGNKIKILPSSTFTSMLYLMKFIANENDLELFDSDIFRNNQKLDEIHLWRNKIKAIRFDARNFVKLSLIDLRGNICIDEIYYLTSKNSALWLQREINLNCSSYIKQRGQLVLKRSKRP